MDPRLADAMLRAGIIDAGEAELLRAELAAAAKADFFNDVYPPLEPGEDSPGDAAAQRDRP